ncbi:MAG: hypothetical protein DRJ42_22010 [Deltaproteobacteria bacterium]|nr:MAG: hypothetical protein DRJ42_22010 [Deltaproteobacteria bacterium]
MKQVHTACQAAVAREAWPVLLLLFASYGCTGMDRHPGEPCEYEGDCVAGASCAVVSQAGGVNTRACVSRCDDLVPPGALAGLCPGGETCYQLRADWPNAFGCFPGGSVPLAGECTYAVDCERGTVCPGAPDAPGECAPVCPAEGCSEGEPCSLFVGAVCAEDLWCALVAYPPSFANTACVPTCRSPDRASLTPTLCPGGETCFQLDETGSIWGCYPGGDVEVGAPCADVSQCVRGAVCGDLGDGLACVRVCAADSDCPTGPCTGGLCSD